VILKIKSQKTMETTKSRNYSVMIYLPQWFLHRSSIKILPEVLSPGLILSPRIYTISEYPKKKRMIIFYHEASKKILRFITNNFELSSEEIADLYKSRWQIELFFKWMKQHLNIKTFYSINENGVKIQIWCAFITYLLFMKS
jgi:hypothetical protein